MMLMAVIASVAAAAAIPEEIFIRDFDSTAKGTSGRILTAVAIDVEVEYLKNLLRSQDADSRTWLRWWA